MNTSPTKGESGSAAITRNAAGQVTGTSATTLGMTVDQALTYDADGRVASLAQSYGGTTRTASATYDLAGRLSTLTYPAGFVIGYEYNKDGQVTVIKKDGTALATYAYDTAGRLATRTLANGVVSTYTYDMANRLESIVVAGGSTVLWAERYGYNAAGERIFTLKGTTGTVGDGYWLDATSQLRGVKYGSANATLAFASQSGYSTASTWQYDAVGNRTEATEGAGTTTYATNTINQYTSVSGVTSVAYSARGDLTQFGDWTYTYDATGNLIRAHNGQSNRLAKYARDVSGHRAVKDVDGAKTVYFNWGTNPLEAWQMGSSTSSSTVYEPGIDRPLAEIGNGGAVAFFYHQDWLGNVVMLSNAQGQVSESYSYDVWGKVTAKDGAGQSVQTPQSRFLFTARELDPETGLYHYRARAYSSDIGRFLQTDPIDFDGGDVNLLRYAYNQPSSLRDPLGLSTSTEEDCPDDKDPDDPNDLKTKLILIGVEPAIADMISRSDSPLWAQVDKTLVGYNSMFFKRESGFTVGKDGSISPITKAKLGLIGSPGLGNRPEPSNTGLGVHHHYTGSPSTPSEQDRQVARRHGRPEMSVSADGKEFSITNGNRSQEILRHPRPR